MTLTTHIGYGSFQLRDLLPGEEFARFDGTPGRVSKQQPLRDHMPNHVAVWLDVTSLNARRVMLHGDALVHALTSEQACDLTQRAKSAALMVTQAQ